MRRRNGALRIALLAPAARPVLPGQDESVEHLVGLLAEGLLARGHDVTLYATGNSQTSARLRSVHPRGYDEDDELWDWYRAESLHAALPFEHAGEHDVIHAHDFGFALPFAGLTRAPLVDTPHTEISPEVLDAYRRHPDVHVVAISDYQRAEFGGRDNVTVIPNGIPFADFPIGDGGGGHLMFLGRMIADKGPADAIRIARAAGLPLVLAGPAQDGYDLRAEIDLDGDDVRWLGRVPAQERNRLLADSIALLFPLVHPEPFGLVLIEAMACGTPVLATELGAVPEIVQQGVTGFTAADWNGLVELIPAAAALDRATVRHAAAEQFDVERMIDRHEALYRQIAEAR